MPFAAPANRVDHRFRDHTKNTSIGWAISRLPRTPSSFLGRRTLLRRIGSLTTSWNSLHGPPLLLVALKTVGYSSYAPVGYSSYAPTSWNSLHGPPLLLVALKTVGYSSYAPVGYSSYALRPEESSQLPLTIECQGVRAEVSFDSRLGMSTLESLGGGMQRDFKLWDRVHDAAIWTRRSPTREDDPAR